MQILANLHVLSQKDNVDIFNLGHGEYEIVWKLIFVNRLENSMNMYIKWSWFF